MNKSRAILVAMILIVVFGVLVASLFRIQITNHELYVKKAYRQQNKSYAVEAERGSIKDRDGKVLSFTKDEVSFFVDTRMAKPKHIKAIAEKFASVFGKDKNYYKSIIDEGSKNVCIEKKVSKDKAVELEDFVQEGLSKKKTIRVFILTEVLLHIYSVM